MKAAAAVYGAACYGFALASVAYAVGFIANLGVPRGIDGGPPVATAQAIAIDALLLAVFALQHSVMARPAFKAAWTRLVPAPVERSTYVLASGLALALLMWAWQPLPEMLWRVEQPAARALLHALYFAGWGLSGAATFMISHADLMGLRQVRLYLRGEPYTAPTFARQALYRYIRHPIMLGMLIAFWAAPDLSAGRLLFAAGMTLYMLAGIRLEERDLLRELGAGYADYRRGTGMLLPRREENEPDQG